MGFICSKIAYKGVKNSNGLFNHSKVKKYMIDNPGGGKFSKMTDEQIVAWFNKIFGTYLTESNSNLNLLPDTFLVPSEVGVDLVSRFSKNYESSLRHFLAKNNLAVEESNGKIPQISIASRAELDEEGSTKKGRIVAYKKDKAFVRIDIPYPIQHFITLPNVDKMSYTSAFVGQVSEIQLPYNNSDQEFGVVTYWDFSE